MPQPVITKQLDFFSNFNDDDYLFLNKNNRNLKLFIDFFFNTMSRIGKKDSKKFFYLVNMITQPNNDGTIKKLFVIDDKLFLNPFFESKIFKKDDVITYNSSRLVFLDEKGNFFKSRTEVNDTTSIYLSSPITHKILEFISDYNEEELSNSFVENTSVKKYSGVISYENYNSKAKEDFKIFDILKVSKDVENDFKQDFIMPNHTYNFRHFIKNLQDNKNLSHLFNYLQPTQSGFKPEERLQRAKIRVNNALSEVNLDIEYTVECNACHLLNRFNRFELSGNVRCASCDGLLKTNNTLLTVSKQITLREYDIAFYDDASNDWIDAGVSCFSTVKLNSGIEEVQFIMLNSVNDKRMMADSSLLILSKNTKFNSAKLDTKIINTQYIPKNRSVMEHIYNYIVKYLKEEHHLYITDQHKLPNIVGVFASLSNFFHGTRMLMCVAGYSGSGKSFFIDNIVPLLHFNSVVVSGSNVSKSKYLGGLPEVTSSFSKNRFAKGVVGTNTMVCVEEFTSVVNDFVVNPKGRSKSLISMEKEMNDKKVKATTHGTKEYPVTATRFYAGNLDIMQSYVVYKNLLRKEYRKLSSGKRLDPALPLYKSIEWYAKNINKEMALAQYNIRSGNNITPTPRGYDVTWDFYNNHYIFQLPPAEMARFHYCFFLEKIKEEKVEELEIKDDEDNMINKEVDTTKLHTQQLRDELNEMFFKVNIQQLRGEEIVKYAKFMKQIEAYVKYDFLARRNNLSFAGDSLNSHVVDRLILRAKSFFMFEKQARKEEFVLTLQDKKLFEGIEIYNYNSLSVLETAMVKKPYVNDAYNFKEDTVAENNIIIIEKEDEERKKEEEEISKLISNEYDESVFDKDTEGGGNNAD